MSHINPYEVEVDINIGSNGQLNITDEIKLNFSDAKTLKIEKQHVNPREETAGIQRIRITLSDFSTASKAEAAGKKIVYALLWFSASKNISIRFQNFIGEYPFRVRDRTVSRGVEMRGEGRVYWNIKVEEIQTVCLEAFNIDHDISNEALISMETFSAAKFESSERAVFLAYMTALEAVCVQKDLGNEIDEIVLLIKDLPKYKEFLSKNPNLTTSFESRVSGLKKESVRQSILRNLRENGFEESKVKAIDKAYGIRSKILHEGLMIRDLSEHSNNIEEVLRQIYSKYSGLSLSRIIEKPS